MRRKERFLNACNEKPGKVLCTSVFFVVKHDSFKTFLWPLLWVFVGFFCYFWRLKFEEPFGDDLDDFFPGLPLAIPRNLLFIRVVNGTQELAQITGSSRALEDVQNVGFWTRHLLVSSSSGHREDVKEFRLDISTDVWRKRNIKT